MHRRKQHSTCHFFSNFFKMGHTTLTIPIISPSNRYTVLHLRTDRSLTGQSDKYILVVLHPISGSRDSAMVRVLASHQCGPGSIPGLAVICGLSLLLVFFPAPRVFLRVLRFSSLHKNQHFQIPIRPGTHGRL